MSGIDVIGAIYAATVATGGLIGYLKAGSVPSLIAGLSFGALAGYGAYTLGTHGDVKFLLGTSFVLGAMMGNKFYNSGKFMPAGLIATLSLLMLGRCLYRLTD